MSGHTATNQSEFYSTEIIDTQQFSRLTFTVPHRYTDLEFLATGAFGAVVSAYDQANKQLVAIKKIDRPCCEAKRAKRAYREFRLLASIRHPNAIHLLDAFIPNQRVEELYLVTEKMDHILNEASGWKRMTHEELSYVLYQLLCGVDHLHKSGIIHRDLNPSNIAINEDMVLKILDFGLARSISEIMSKYVVTRYYRAPEIIWQIPYDQKADVWSIGCIFAELILQRVLLKGDSAFDQWSTIVDTFGSPPEGFVRLFCRSTRKILKSMPYVPQRSISLTMRDSDFNGRVEISPHLTVENCQDLLDHMLRIDPGDRYSVAECLAHPYVQRWFNEEDVSRPASANHYDQEIETLDKSVQGWKELLYHEVRRFRNTRSSSPEIIVLE